MDQCVTDVCGVFYQAVDNPLEDPPYDQIIKGLEPLMWYLRQR
jgi:hypothetical protein